MADEAIGLVEAAQRPDGYLNTFVQVLAPGTRVPRSPVGPRALLHRPSRPGRHRLAPCARRRSSPPRRRACGSPPSSGRSGRAAGTAIDGHPEIEMALVELYRATGERRYLELAAAFIERRGHGSLGAGRFGRGYWQDHLPVREAPSACRPCRPPAVPGLRCGRRRRRDGRRRELLDAVHRRWRDMVATKMYLTGALGSRHKDEAFGDPFELPPDRAYAETCAAIASRHARLAAAARDRRPGLRRRHRADDLQRRPARAVARRDGVLLRQPAPAPDAPGVGRGRQRRARSRGTPAPAARRT